MDRLPSIPFFVLLSLGAFTSAAAQPTTGASSSSTTPGTYGTDPSPGPPGTVPLIVEPLPLAPSPSDEPVRFGTPVASSHALYVEGTTMILMNSIGLHYAFRPVRGFAISAGIGTGAATGILVSASGWGGQALAHFLLGGPSSHSFEVAAGAALMKVTGSVIFSDAEDEDPQLRVFPSAFLGYRYQPLAGGLLMRAGGAWSFGYGIGLSASVGFSF